MKKTIKKLLLAVLLLPVVAMAHPGHEESSVYAGSQHILSGTEPQLIYLALALFTVAAFWLLNRR